MVVDGVDGVDRKDFQKIKEDLKRLKNYQFIRDDLVLSYLFYYYYYVCIQIYSFLPFIFIVIHSFDLWFTQGQPNHF